MITCKNNFGETVCIPKEKFIFRPSVYGVIENKGRILVARVKSTKKLWLPGGGLEVGESNKEGLIREIREETGITTVEVGALLDMVENLYYYAPLDSAMHAHCFFYACTTDEETLAKDEEIQDFEAHGLMWADPKTLQPEDFTDLGPELHALLQRHYAH